MADICYKNGMVEINPEFVDVFKNAKAPFAIMGVGLPGIGKTKQLQGLAKDLNVGFANLPIAHREFEYLEINYRRALSPKELINLMVRRAIKDSGSVVIDAHHSTEIFRRSTQAAARRRGAQAVAVISFDASLDYALQRQDAGFTSADARKIEVVNFNLGREPVGYHEGFDLILDHGIPDGPSVIRAI